MIKHVLSPSSKSQKPQTRKIGYKCEIINTNPQLETQNVTDI